MDANHVATNANPGSGKTTTILNIIRTAMRLKPNSVTLTFAYNRALSNSTNACIQRLKWKDQAFVYTFHGFCGQYLHDHEICDDFAMMEMLTANGVLHEGKRTGHYPILPLGIRPQFLVVDECQDMNILYYVLVHWMLRCMTAAEPGLQMALLGDRRQAESIYRGADPRFLTQAAKLFGVKIVDCEITKTYRLTETMTSFLNTCVQLQPGPPIVSASRRVDPPPVKIVIDYPSQLDMELLRQLLDYHRQGWRWKDMAWLVPSLRDTRFEHTRLFLYARGVPIWRALNPNEEFRGDMVRMSTFWGIKGETVPIVFVSGMDSGFVRSNPSWNDFKAQVVAPPPHYVAMTRASEALILMYPIHNERMLPYYLRLDRYLDAIEQDTPPPFELKSTSASQHAAAEFVIRCHEKHECLRYKLANYSPDQHGDWRTYFGVKSERIERRSSVTSLCAFVDTDFMLAELHDMKTALFQRHANTPDQQSVCDHAPPVWSVMQPTDRGTEMDVSDVMGIAIPLYIVEQLRAETSLLGRERDDEAIEDATEESLDVTEPQRRAMVRQHGDIRSRMALVSLPKLPSDKKRKRDGPLESEMEIPSEMRQNMSMLSRRLETAITAYRYEQMEEFLSAASLMLAADGELERAASFSTFGWVNTEMQDQIDQVTKYFLAGDGVPRTERLIKRRLVLPDKEVTIYGMVDLQLASGMWELKCVQFLRMEHFLQVLLYAWISEIYPDLQALPIRLLNIRSGECWVLPRTLDVTLRIHRLIERLVRNRDLSDEERLAAHNEWFS